MKDKALPMDTPVALGKDATSAVPVSVKRAVKTWFDSRAWKPFAFQIAVWKAVANGQSGLLHATTGAGKTYAVWFAALQAFSPRPSTRNAKIAPTEATKRRDKKAAAVLPLTVLWITPMRALAADTVRALQEAVDGLNTQNNLATHSLIAPWSVGARTGDTSSTERSAQSRQMPSVLVTTPESLSVMLARYDAREMMATVRMVVVDEWHELIASKRGVQVQLALARLRTWTPSTQRLCVWGMSATLGNLEAAMQALLGVSTAGVLVRGAIPKKLVIDTLLPGNPQRFPWAGHLGLSMLPQVIHEIEASSTSLIFTNTRSQAELWFNAILEARPDWAGIIALHHGSLDREVREWVEAALKNGQLKAAICTSSLDLGVDFLPVERVLQIGSTKGVARLLQRAGRSGHAPGRPSRITLVPTHSLELIEAAAARTAALAGQIESRTSPVQPLDVLVQHLVTVALGGGFTADALFDEVRQTMAYRDLSVESWQWCLDFVRQGGPSLVQYPDYRRAVPNEAGVWRVPDAQLARRHRQNIGTISSSASIVVQFVGAGRIGTIEENFIARLTPGDCFLFGGRVLALVRVHQMTAYVKRASSKRPAVPRWAGGRMPLSSTLADAMVQQLDAVVRSDSHTLRTPEIACAVPMLLLQQRWSALPTSQTLLVESLRSREGWHLFIYPFAGRNVHTGIANLFAWRASRQQSGTFSMAVNDYGFELLSAAPIDWSAHLPALLLRCNSRESLLDEVLSSLNASELARRRFRDIARVSGLVYEGRPDERKSSRQLQASSTLFYDVFRKYDADNKLLLQADQELLNDELDIERLSAALIQMSAQTPVVKTLQQPSPFAFPLMVERLREQLSTESVAERIARMVQQLEAAADAPDMRRRSKSATAQSATLGQAAATTEDIQQKLAFSQDTNSRSSLVSRGRDVHRPDKPKKRTRKLQTKPLQSKLQ
jgi:ATP-dependent helicase Lhr and Lhr-like helicase